MGATRFRYRRFDRRLLFAGPWLFVLLLGTPTRAGDEKEAITPGDTVVVTSDAADLKIGQRVIATLSKGQRLIVDKVESPWLWTHAVIEGRRKEGWVHFSQVSAVSTSGQHSSDTSPFSLDADAYWSWAQKKDTAQANRCFVYRYPDDPRAGKAKERWAELEFLAAEEEGTRAAYRSFLRRHPRSQFAANAADHLDSGPPHASETANGSASGSRLRRQSVDVLRGALMHSDGWVRAHAAQALGQIGDPRVVGPLLAALADTEGFVQWSTAKALGRIGEPSVVDALLSASKNPVRSVRAGAAVALGMTGESRAVDPLLLLLKDNDEGIRRYAMYALGLIGDPRAVDGLLTALIDRDFLVAPNARLTLVQMADPHEVDPVLAALVYHRHRANAAYALGHSGDAHAVNRLLFSLKDTELRDTELSTRRNVALALGHIGDPRAVDGLLEAANDGSIRSSAVLALGLIGDLRAVDRIGELLTDSNAEVRADAALAMVPIAHPRMLRPLVEVLKDTHSRGRMNAALALAQIDDARVVDVLLPALNDPEWLVRARAALAFGQRAERRALDSLVRALRDPNPWVQRLAAWALGEIGHPRAVDSLLVALKDPKESVPSSAAFGLAKIALKDGDLKRLVSVHGGDGGQLRSRETYREAGMKERRQAPDGSSEGGGASRR